MRQLFSLVVLAGLLSLSLMLLAGCDGKDEASAPSTPRPNVLDPANHDVPDPVEHEYHFLALGDSYTIGQSVLPQDRFPVQLAAALRKKDIDIANPKIIARTGWTTFDLANAIDKAKPDTNYDLVTILIGVNNQFQGKSIEEYRVELADLLKKSIAFADGDASHVIGFSIPDWGPTPYGKGDPTGDVKTQIDAFNQVMSEECAKLKIVVVDVTSISRTVADHPDLMAIDGLHPSGKQYKLWVEAALPAAVKALSEDDKAAKSKGTPKGK